MTDAHSESESAFSARRTIVGAILLVAGLIGIAGVIAGATGGNPVLAVSSVVLAGLAAYLLYATYAEAVRTA